MLTKEQVAEIREFYALGMTQSHLAAHFGVNQSAISKIVNGVLHHRIPMQDVLRYCIDCGTPLVRAHKRCDECKAKMNTSYFEQWRLENRPPQRRYKPRQHNQ